MRWVGTAKVWLVKMWRVKILTTKYCIVPYIAIYYNNCFRCIFPHTDVYILGDYVSDCEYRQSGGLRSSCCWSLFLPGPSGEGRLSEVLRPLPFFKDRENHLHHHGISLRNQYRYFIFGQFHCVFCSELFSRTFEIFLLHNVTFPKEYLELFFNSFHVLWTKPMIVI